MSQPSPSKETEAIVAFLDAVDAGIVQARRILGQPTREKKPTFDPAKIKWMQVPTGTKGPYEKATDEENGQNPDYLTLKSILKESPEHHGGFLYWLFTDGIAVGRRKKEKAQ